MKNEIHKFIEKNQMNTQNIDNVDTNPLITELPSYVKKQLIVKIYSLLSMQLMFTVGIASLFTLHQPLQEWVIHNKNLYFASFFASFACIFLFSCYQKRFPINLICFIGFTTCESYAIGALSAIYAYQGQGLLVLESAAVTMGIFMMLTIYVCASNRDFRFLEPFLFSTLLVILFMSVITTFWGPIPFLSLMISFTGILLFIGYILYDTSIILKTIEPDNALSGAMQLYLDIINMFLFVLECLTSQRAD